MKAGILMAKRDLLKLPDDFEANVRALLGTPPAPHDTTGSRKAAPPSKAKAKPKQKPKRKAYRRTKAEAAAHRAAQEQGVRYEYEAAPVLKDYARAKGKTVSKTRT